MGQKEDAEETGNNKRFSIPEQVKSSQAYHVRKKSNSSIGNMATSLNTKLEDQSQVVPIDNEQRLLLPSFVPGDLKKLDEKVKSMMEKSQNRIRGGLIFENICKVCGKEGDITAIKDHIETHHLEGVSLPCNGCGKVFRSRSVLRKHSCAN